MTICFLKQSSKKRLIVCFASSNIWNKTGNLVAILPCYASKTDFTPSAGLVLILLPLYSLCIFWPLCFLVVLIAVKCINSSDVGWVLSWWGSCCTNESCSLCISPWLCSATPSLITHLGMWIPPLCFSFLNLLRCLHLHSLEPNRGPLKWDIATALGISCFRKHSSFTSLFCFILFCLTQVANEAGKAFVKMAWRSSICIFAMRMNSSRCELR